MVNRQATGPLAAGAGIGNTSRKLIFIQFGIQNGFSILLPPVQQIFPPGDFDLQPGTIIRQVGPGMFMQQQEEVPSIWAGKTIRFVDQGWDQHQLDTTILTHELT